MNKNEMEQYAFNKMKDVLFQENCKSVVIVDMMENLGLEFAEAKSAANYAFEKWSDIYE